MTPIINLCTLFSLNQLFRIKIIIIFWLPSINKINRFWGSAETTIKSVCVCMCQVDQQVIIHSFNSTLFTSLVVFIINEPRFNSHKNGAIVIQYHFLFETASYDYGKRGNIKKQQPVNLHVCVSKCELCDYFKWLCHKFATNILA